MAFNASDYMGLAENDTTAPNVPVPAFPPFPTFFILPDEAPFDTGIFELIEIILRIAITGSLALSGIIINIINAVMFYRQGLVSDGSTVSLFGLAVAEFWSCLLNLVGQFLLILLYFTEYWHWSWHTEDFYFTISARIRAIFTQITCWITAYIAVERFVSVVFPFKVKQIMTPKRSCFIVACIFVVTIALYYPQYIRLRLAKMSSTFQVREVWGYVDFGEITTEHYDAFLYTHVIGLRALSILIVAVCNVVIVWKVLLSTRFRKTSAAAATTSSSGGGGGGGSSSSSKIKMKKIKNKKEEDDSTTTTVGNYEDLKGDNSNSSKINKDDKEQRLIRMMLFICVVFVVCTSPDLIIACWLYVGVKDPHYYTSDTAFAVAGLFEIISANANIFIYYSLSTRYRKELDRTCLCAWRKYKSSSTSSFAGGGSTKGVSSTKMTNG